jgi:hypothetical protein
MKALVWKECRENCKWAVLPTLVIGGLIAFLGPPSLMDGGSLFIVGLIAAGFGAVLGFLQVFSESRGDKRSLLLHRPLGRSQIFLGKAVAGVGLYLLALGVPFAWAVGLAATPGHIAEPFGWPMVLPWLADVLTGVVWYFAGMLAAQREARWYGSRCLDLAAGLFCSILVWTLPEFWQALAAVAVVGGLVAAAAWGSFLAGGAYAPQPRLAKVALAATLLMGLSALGFLGKVFLGVWTWDRSEHYHRLDNRGRVVLVHEEYGKLRSISDLEGRVPPELLGERLDYYTLREAVAPWARRGWPNTQSYRNSDRFLVKYGDRSKPGNEEWWYVPSRGRLLGYDKHSKRAIGSFGPDGFAPPDGQPGGRFEGELAHVSREYLSRAYDYLAFPGGVYAVDFHKRTLQTLFVPAAGETVLWANRWENEKEKRSLAFVGTDRAVLVMDEAGRRVLSAPLAYNRETYRIQSVGRLEDPPRYWIWYEPAWWLGLEALETMPAYVVTYDSTGREVSPRQVVPPRPGGAREVTPPLPPVEASPARAWFGLATSPAESAVLVGTTRSLEAEVRGNNGTEMALLLQFLFATTQLFLPGVRWDPGAHAGLVWGFAALTLLSSAVCALACLLLARRYCFSRTRCLGWSLCGFLFGATGLLLMLAVQEWPARIACPGCRKPRVVTRDTCEHCGAPHAAPALDGTEIFEEVAATPHALAGR